MKGRRKIVLAVVAAVAIGWILAWVRGAYFYDHLDCHVVVATRVFRLQFGSGDGLLYVESSWSREPLPDETIAEFGGGYLSWEASRITAPLARNIPRIWGILPFQCAVWDERVQSRQWRFHTLIFPYWWSGLVPALIGGVYARSRAKGHVPKSGFQTGPAKRSKGDTYEQAVIKRN